MFHKDRDNKLNSSHFFLLINTLCVTNKVSQNLVCDRSSPHHVLFNAMEGLASLQPLLCALIQVICRLVDKKCSCEDTVSFILVSNKTRPQVRIVSSYFNPILPGGGGAKYAPLLFFLHHPKTAHGITLKLSDFKDTLLRHILQVKPVR